MDQKKNSCNFATCELDVLIAEVEAAKDVLFGKLSSALTSDVKRSCWSNITEKVNSVSGGVIRTDKAVKKKWVDLCSVVKKKEAARRRALHSTGGGEFIGTTLSDAEVKVVALLTNEAIEGVCGGVDIGVISKFKCARPKSIIRRSTEQIMYRYGYFNKNVYFAKHNNC